MKDKFDPKTATLLGVDFGKTNIGLAIGRNGLVTPLHVVQGTNVEHAINEINKIIIENQIQKIVVGVPLTAEGKETNQSFEIRRLSKILKIMTKRPVEFQNEYNSSAIALQEAISSDISEKKRRSNDHFAAALILRNYYTEQLDIQP